MIIAHNLQSLKMSNNNERNINNIQKTTGKLSSGLRIVRASDDAAGLAISEKMRSQIRGLEQASRNIQDGISLIQIGEGALSEMQSLLQRGRELSVQGANGVLNLQDKQSIQLEVDKIREEIDNISKTTNYNNIKLFDDIIAPPSTGGGTPPSTGTIPPGAVGLTEDEQILYTIKQSALQQSELLIKNYFGLEANNVDLKIIIDNTDTSALAYVRYNVNLATGKGYNLELHLEKADFLPPTWPDGGSYPFYNDRIIAHEMTHAVMSQTMNFYSLPKWFKEGTAEFMHGADERLMADAYYSGTANVVNAIGVGTDATWAGGSIGYSAGYAAVRYLHEHIKANGGTGIKDIMSYLNTNQMATLDTALKNIPNGAYAGGMTGFINDFKANGVAFINGLDISYGYEGDDTGAVGGFDADGGTVRTAKSVIPDIDNYTENPLSGFNEIWPSTSTSGSTSPLEGIYIEVEDRSVWENIFTKNISVKDKLTATPLKTLKLQTGAYDEEISIELSQITATTLDIMDVDIISDSKGAVNKYDQALKLISNERGKFGALQNRLEHTLQVVYTAGENTTKSESQIRDVDMAKEMMTLSKQNVLQSAISSLMAQANQSPQAVLQLLRT